MSENIDFSQNKTSKKHGTSTYNPRSSSAILERKDSNVTKCSQFAVIGEKIPLASESPHIQCYKKVYDKLFREFKEKLVHEYVLMRTAYLTEYEQNYQENLL